MASRGHPLLYGLIGAALTTLALIDFRNFCQTVSTLEKPISPKADAVIVLTGGSGRRIAAGVGLLETGAAPKMLISGVHPDVTLEEIRTLADGPPALYSCCIELGHMAETTLGNASETARWAKDRSYSKLIIVTSNYHMPRSLILLRRAMPELDLIAYPAQSELDPAKPFADLHAFKGLATEWGKWRIMRLRYGGTQQQNETGQS